MMEGVIGRSGGREAGLAFRHMYYQSRVHCSEAVCRCCRGRGVASPSSCGCGVRCVIVCSLYFDRGLALHDVMWIRVPGSLLRCAWIGVD
jgi:hypothetical protein